MPEVQREHVAHESTLPHPRIGWRLGSQWDSECCRLVLEGHGAHQVVSGYCSANLSQNVRTTRSNQPYMQECKVYMLWYRKLNKQ